MGRAVPGHDPHAPRSPEDHRPDVAGVEPVPPHHLAAASRLRVGVGDLHPHDAGGIEEAVDVLPRAGRWPDPPGCRSSGSPRTRSIRSGSHGRRCAGWRRPRERSRRRSRSFRSRAWEVSVGWHVRTPRRRPGPAFDPGERPPRTRGSGGGAPVLPRPPPMGSGTPRGGTDSSPAAYRLKRWIRSPKRGAIRSAATRWCSSMARIRSQDSIRAGVRGCERCPPMSIPSSSHTVTAFSLAGSPSTAPTPAETTSARESARGESSLSGSPPPSGSGRCSRCKRRGSDKVDGSSSIGF